MPTKTYWGFVALPVLGQALGVRTDKVCDLDCF